MSFSILIPVYNADKYLEACVQSILPQITEGDEIILWDDASEDRSLKICKAFAKEYPERIRLMRHEENEGLLLTRRHLFSVAKGEYFLCVDADDELAPNALAMIQHAFEQYDADMVVFNALCVHRDGRKERFIPSLTDNHLYTGDEKQTVYAALFQNTYLNSLCTKAFHRKILDLSEDYNPWRHLSVGEDLFQSYPLFDHAERIIYLNDDLYLYYKRDNSMTMIRHESFPEMREMLWERENQYISAWKINKNISQRRYTRRCNEMIHHLVSSAGYRGYPSFRLTAIQIRKSICFSDLDHSVRLRGRYQLYQFLLISEHWLSLYWLIKAERIMLKVKTIMKQSNTGDSTREQNS